MTHTIKLKEGTLQRLESAICNECLPAFAGEVDVTTGHNTTSITASVDSDGLEAFTGTAKGDTLQGNHCEAMEAVAHWLDGLPTAAYPGDTTEAAADILNRFGPAVALQVSRLIVDQCLERAAPSAITPGADGSVHLKPAI